jgi:hypothetical protein
MYVRAMHSPALGDIYISIGQNGRKWASGLQFINVIKFGKKMLTDQVYFNSK